MYCVSNTKCLFIPLIIGIMWEKQCHKPAMTGNGLNPSYLYLFMVIWGMVHFWFTHITRKWGDKCQLNHQGPCEKKIVCIQSYIDIYPIYHESFFKQSGMNVCIYIYMYIYHYIYSTTIYIYIYIIIYIYIYHYVFKNHEI